ncbi:beta-ketoacyl synthase N-terminal-like domain-containing protein [Streptomyces sp. M19]
MAIVGIGCRYPGGIADPRGFWDLLVSRTDAIGDVPRTAGTPTPSTTPTRRPRADDGAPGASSSRASTSSTPASSA